MIHSAITCENLSMHYEADKPVLRNVSFALEPGSFHFLTGKSGAGKSTLLSLLALTQRPRSGSIQMFGQEVSNAPAEILPGLRRRIGTIYQDYRLLNHLTVLENIALPLKIAGIDLETRLQHSRDMLQWIDMEAEADSRPETLSGGQKQRVAIARAVMNKPDLILADEPTGNLDAVMSVRCMRLFEALNREGTTVLIASHDEALLERMHKPVFRLKRGRIIRQKAYIPDLPAALRHPDNMVAPPIPKLVLRKQRRGVPEFS